MLTFGVDGTRDTVGETDVELGQGVFLVDGSVRQISDGGGLDHVLNRVSLDGLVLGEKWVSDVRDMAKFLWIGVAGG